MGFEEYCKGEVSSFITSYRQYMVLTWLTTGDVNHSHLVKVMFARFFHYKAAVFPYCIPWKLVTKSSPHLGGGGMRIKLHFLEKVVSTYIIWNPSVKEDLFLFPCFFIVINLYQHGLTYLVYVLGYNHAVYLVAQIGPVLATGVCSRLASVPLTHPHSSVTWALPYFLELEEIPGPSYSFPVLTLESAS